MILKLFSFLSSSLETITFFTFLAAFLWGVLSIILSPCHLSSIPLIVGFINGQEKADTKRAFQLSLSFSIGILITIGIIGIITGLMGRMLGDIGKFGNYFVAVIFFIVGIYLLDIIPFQIPVLFNGKLIKGKGIFAAFLLGLIFGIALGPCSFAYMAPMLAITFQVSGSNLLLGILLLFLYALGHCSVIVIAGTFVEFIESYLNWNSKSKGMILIKRICGILVILGGVYLIISSI